jgi:hypothetical protein
VAGERDGQPRKRLGLNEPLAVEGFVGLMIFQGMRWTERVVTDTTTVTSEASGTPRLRLEQLDEKGEPYAGRVIVNEKLTAWRVEKDGQVTCVNPPVIVPPLRQSDPQGE